jgi:hypothetical protein
MSQRKTRRSSASLIQTTAATEQMKYVVLSIALLVGDTVFDVNPGGQMWLSLSLALAGVNMEKFRHPTGVSNLI